MPRKTISAKAPRALAPAPATLSSPPPSKLITSMSQASDKTILVLVANETEIFKVECSKLRVFEAWWATQETKDSANFTLDFNKKSLPIFEPEKNYLETFKAFLYVLHHPESAQEPVPVAQIWHLAQMNTTLGLTADFVNWLAQCMANFVGAILRNGLDVPAGIWEKALAACVLFDWADFYREIAARLAFLCGSVTDLAGKAQLVKPDGDQIIVGLCGEIPYANILAARTTIMTKVIKEAEDGIKAWINRLARFGCAACQGNRIGALTTALMEVGVYPRKTPQDVTKSLHQICEELDEDKGMSPKVKQFAVMCDECDERAPTSSLFPVEDILYNIQDGRHGELRDLIDVPTPDQL